MYLSNTQINLIYAFNVYHFINNLNGKENMIYKSPKISNTGLITMFTIYNVIVFFNII